MARSFWLRGGEFVRRRRTGYPPAMGSWRVRRRLRVAICVARGAVDSVRRLLTGAEPWPDPIAES